jgi:hypothetical protein
MSTRKNFRQRRTSSSSSSDEEIESKEENSDQQQAKLSKREKIEELKFIQKQRQRTHGIDVYSLAIGEQESSKSISTQELIDVI